MKKCIAFVEERGMKNAWRECRHRAQRGSVFCRCHERVATGVVLGLCVHSYRDTVEIEKDMLKEMAVKSQVPS